MLTRVNWRLTFEHCLRTVFVVITRSLSFFLFLCLLATSRKNYWSDLREKNTKFLWTRYNNRLQYKCWKSSACVSWSANFWKDSSTLQYKAFFHNLAHISGKKTNQIFMKSLPSIEVSLDKEVSSRLALLDHICLDGDLCTPSVLVHTATSRKREEGIT